MIKYLLMLMLLGSCVSEPSIDYLVKDSVRLYLLDNINDRDKYESISYGVIDSLHHTPFDVLVNNILIGDTLDVGGFYGYSVTHKFRATNELGVLVLYEEVFILDTNYVVIDVY